MGNGLDKFFGWTEFKRELRHYFIPQNEHLRIIDEWKMLKQGDGQLTLYTEKYRQMTLQLPHVHQITKLHGFLSGLRPRIRMEVEKMNLQTCEEAMRIAERIGDIEGSSRLFYNNQGGMFSKRNWVGTTSSNGRGIARGEPSRTSWTSSMGHGASSTSNITTTSPHTPMVRRGCFECGEPHLVSECPKKKQFPIRAATSQLNLSEIEDGVAPDMDTVLAQYEDNEEEAIVSAGAITTRPTCLTIKLNNTSNLFLNIKING